MESTAFVTQEEMIPYEPSSDEAGSLVASARAGDREAFDALASTYRRRILSVARRITRNLEDAEDVTQQTLMKAFINIRDFRGSCAFTTWLTRIAINEALMCRRKLRAHPAVSWSSSSDFEEPGLIPEVPDRRPDPEQCYAAKESHEVLLAAIQRLSPESRTLLEFRGLNEGSINDLALAQGTSIASAKSRLFRSRRLLRTELKRLLRGKARQFLRSAPQPA
jgi:RNA polymerase sigma-70 factor (ECF subfamily)